jgi:hypothetical protein
MAVQQRFVNSPIRVRYTRQEAANRKLACEVLAQTDAKLNAKVSAMRMLKQTEKDATERAEGRRKQLEVVKQPETLTPMRSIRKRPDGEEERVHGFLANLAGAA